MTYLALLRGINVGGKARLPMKELATLFAQAGAADVRTYIQSGNLIFGADDPAEVIAEVTREIALRYGYPGKIILRSTAELQAALNSNPFQKAGAPQETLHVYFLNDLPLAASIRSLDSDRSPGDSFVLHAREIYLHLPNGMARTKLTNAYFDTKLKTVSTARNWNTVAKLAELVTIGPAG